VILYAGKPKKRGKGRPFKIKEEVIHKPKLRNIYFHKAYLNI